MKMTVTTDLPEDFFHLKKEEQENFLVKRYQKITRIENYYRHLMGHVRGGNKIRKIDPETKQIVD